jgi:hypothetical protein
MLYSDYTKVLVTNYNKSKIEKQFGDKLNIEIDEYLKIPVYLLPDGSGYKIEALCDFCEKVYNTEWRKYLKIENNDGKHCCNSKKCVNKKRKETSLKEWGVDNPMKSNEVKKKIEKSILDKWGVDHYSKTNEFKDKIKQTTLDKWGVDHYSKTDEFKDKFKETSLNKWGVDNPSKSEIIKEKIKEISLDKWGVDNYSKTNEFKDKIKQTSLDKWGVDSYSKTEECKRKVNSDNKEKWEVNNYNKSNLSKVGKKIFSENFITYLKNKTSLYKCEKGHEFEIKSDNYLKRIESNIPLCTVCNPIGDSKSIKEKELYEFIKSIYKGEIIQSYRDGLEIDIYLPNLNLGFEFNGLYWHSDKYRNKSYHLDKSKYFSEKGIRIIHIWEDDWSLKNKIIKSQIRNWLCLTENKIFARKCHVKEVKDTKIATKFLEENHVQGKVGSSLKLGLYYNKELVSLMTFDHYEGRKKMKAGGWNINRFCNKIDYNIIGGASKLFKYFLNNYHVKRIISYADRDWSEGDLYKKLGFKKVNSSDPDYKYIIEGIRVHKSRFRKSKTGISENKLNINKIWDCGKIKWEFIIE